MQTLKEHSINTFPIKQNCEKTSSDRSKKCCTAKRATDMFLCLWLRDGFLQSWFQISVYFFMLDFRKGTATGMCKEAFHKWSKTFNLQIVFLFHWHLSMWVSCWATMLEHGACRGVWLINPMTLHWRNWFLVGNSFPWLGMELCVHFLSQCLEPTWFEPV